MMVHPAIYSIHHRSGTVLGGNHPNTNTSQAWHQHPHHHPHHQQQQQQQPLPPPPPPSVTQQQQQQQQQQPTAIRELNHKSKTKKTNAIDLDLLCV